MPHGAINLLQKRPRRKNIAFSTKTRNFSTKPAVLSTQPTDGRVDPSGSADLRFMCRRGGKPTLQGEKRTKPKADRKPEHVSEAA